MPRVETLWWTGLLSSAGGSLRGEYHYLGLSFGLCCWQIEYSAVLYPDKPWWVEVHFTRFMHYLYPCQYGHYIWAHLTVTEVDGERSSPTAPEYLILSTQLLKSLSVEVTLWWAYTWDTKHFAFCAHLEMFIQYFSRSSCYQFSNCVSSNSLTTQPDH